MIHLPSREDQVLEHKLKLVFAQLSRLIDGINNHWVPNISKKEMTILHNL